MMKQLIVCGAIGAMFLGLACSHSDDGHSHDTTDGGRAHVSPYPTCQAIIDKCHELDVEEGPIHACHDIAHAAKSDGDCVPKKAECFAICVEQDAGADASTDASDGGG